MPQQPTMEMQMPTNRMHGEQKTQKKRPIK